MDPIIGSIWGLACVMTSCAICHQSTQCYKCEIFDLKLKVRQLQSELSRYYTSDVEKLNLTYKDKQLFADCTTIRTPVPIVYDYKDELSTSHFVTITFDPARFGMQPFDDERKDYILHKLTNLISKQLIKKCYGSFERHKNGIIHSHLIINAQQEDVKKIKQQLKSYFTDNPYNKIVIDIGPAKYPQAKDYIDKESDDYYLIFPKPVKACCLPCGKINWTPGGNPTNKIKQEVNQLNDLDFGIE